MAYESPHAKRPCRDGCGTEVFLARKMPTGKWLAFDADEIPEGSDLRSVQGVCVLIGDTAWTRRDLLENYELVRELPPDRARRLADEYPHHKVHHHHEERDTDDADDS